MEKKVVFKNSIGLNLAARIIGIRPQKSPVIIFAHGLNSGKDSPRNVSIAEALKDAGFACFMFDFTGHGESEGTIGEAVVERFEDDLISALDCVEKEDWADAERIGVVGSSMGGTAAMMLASKESRIKALVLRSSPSFGYSNAANDVRIPTLIVQGDMDPIERDSRILYANLGGEKKLVIIEGADHLYSKEEHLSMAKDAIVRWFVEKFSSSNPGIKVFRDREEAGRLLCEKLNEYKSKKDVIVLALPRGGVAVGRPIADYLNCPLDVLIVRKIGFPGQSEFAIGAVSETGAVVLNEETIASYDIKEDYIKEEIDANKKEIDRRIEIYRQGRHLPSLKDLTVILVDDGVATGATVKAALSALKEEGLKELILALPVAPPETAKELEKMADKFICLSLPQFFISVGSYYEDFTQVTDEEVVEMLKIGA